MKRSIIGLVACLTLLLGGCAVTPQKPVALKNDAIKADSGPIGVAMTTVPKADAWFPGANCLLCILAASATNSALIEHTKTLPNEDLAELKQEFLKLLKTKGAETIEITAPLKIEELANYSSSEPNTARKDFSSLQEKYGISKLLLIHINAIGFMRPYSAYFPAGEPQATLFGRAYLVDLKTNAYDWYQPLEISKRSEGSWDEPPKYPGLTNAYFQTIELSKDNLIQSFTAPPPEPVAENTTPAAEAPTTTAGTDN